MEKRIKFQPPVGSDADEEDGETRAETSHVEIMREDAPSEGDESSSDGADDSDSSLPDKSVSSLPDRQKNKLAKAALLAERVMTLAKARSYAAVSSDVEFNMKPDLQVSIEVQHAYFRSLVTLGVFASLLWPLCALALPVLMVVGRRKEELHREGLAIRKASLVLKVSLAAGLVLHVGPFMLVSVVWSLYHGKWEPPWIWCTRSLRNRNLMYTDLALPMINHFLIVMSIVYLQSVYGISHTVDKAKQLMEQWWRDSPNRESLGLKLDVSRLAKFDARFQGARQVLLEDLLEHVLKKLPGWQSKVWAEAEAEQHEEDEVLAMTSSRQTSTPMTIDAFAVSGDRTPHAPRFSNLLSYLSTLISAAMANGYAGFAAILAVNLVRVVAPRIYAHAVEGGVLVPQDAAALAYLVVMLPINFAVGMLWILLFYCTIVTYSDNRQQMMLLSAIVDAQVRVTYARDYLRHVEPEKRKARQYMYGLPILSLRHPTNALAFWRLREFVLMDQANERLGASLMIELQITYLAIGVSMTVCLLILGHRSLVVIALWDILLIGGLTLLCLQIAVEINGYLSLHLLSLADARQIIVEEVAQAVDLSANIKEKEQAVQDGHHRVAILDHLMKQVERFDNSERLIFGFEVTPTSVLYVVISLFASVFTILEKAIKMGIVQPEDTLPVGPVAHAATELQNASSAAVALLAGPALHGSAALLAAPGERILAKAARMGRHTFLGPART